MDEHWRTIVFKKMNRLNELAEWASNAGYERVRVCCKLAENYLMRLMEKDCDFDPEDQE